MCRNTYVWDLMKYTHKYIMQLCAIDQLMKYVYVGFNEICEGLMKYIRYYEAVCY